jgi:hypothetical protein
LEAKPVSKSKIEVNGWNNQPRRSLNVEVFNGRDAGSRRAAIDELWNKDGVFINPGGVEKWGVDRLRELSPTWSAGSSVSCAPDILP